MHRLGMDRLLLRHRGRRRRDQRPGVLYRAVEAKADRSASWGVRLPARPAGARHTVKVEFPAGSTGFTALYWEPAEGHRYRAVLAATVLGADRSRLRDVWRDNGK